MTSAPKKTLHGWGRTPVAECTAWRPEKQRNVQHILGNHDRPLIARGMGRSYGDASLQPEGVLCTQRLNHFLTFDSGHGIVTAQAGVTLAELMEIGIPKGWLPPVIPGTRHVTLGGCFAANVHGKNQFAEGDFAEHVLRIKLTRANGESVECSPDTYPDLFWATAGGMGMTGIIEEITLKLKPVTSSTLSTTSYKVGSLTDMMAAFELYRSNSDYMVGWIDHMASHNQLGRGIFESARHLLPADGGEPVADYIPAETRFNVPVYAPPFLLNRYSMALYNRWHFRKYSSERVTEHIGFNNFFHPLDSIGHWYRLYGKRGFYQYQCLIPETSATPAVLQELLTLIHEYKLFSFLAVLKYHRDGVGFLTFSQKGYSLALDFPNTARVRAFLPLLDSFVAEHGGRVYLAKDAQLSAAMFDRMYGENASQWKEVLQDADPEHRMLSLMAQRLRWKSTA
ncbi:MAG: FAD-binding protein [Alphaproteobacteria bacterium]